MSILIITADQARHQYLCLAIAEAFGGVSIMQEPKGSGGRRQSRWRRFLASKHKTQLVANAILNRWYRQANEAFQREKDGTEYSYFSDASRIFTARYAQSIAARVAPGKSINDAEYVDRIREMRPDIIVVMGTSLIKKDIMILPRLGVLNLHTGLSPYYRGGLSNFWPIINKEPQYCGVTVHALDLGVDSGDIVYNGLPVIDARDTFSSINCKAITLGVELMKRAIQDLQSGALRTKKQWLKGKLYGQRDINNFHLAKYAALLRKGYIGEYARRAAEGRVRYPEGLSLCFDKNLPQHTPAEYTS